MINRVDKELAFMLQFENVAWYDDGCVKILDRRVYPNKVNFVECKTHKEVSKAIADMVTQSAGPYLAVAMGMALAGYESRHLEGKMPSAMGMEWPPGGSLRRRSGEIPRRRPREKADDRK